MMINAHEKSTSLWKPLNSALSASWWTSICRMICLLNLFVHNHIGRDRAYLSASAKPITVDRVQVFSGLIEREEHASTFDPDGITSNGFSYRRTHGRPGTDVKPALVQRAFD